MNKTINKNNWSGEMVTYNFRGKSIRIHDTTIMLRVSKDGESAKVLLKDWCGKNNHHELCTAYFYHSTWNAEKYGCSREAEQLDEVAIQMYCNLV